MADSFEKRLSLALAFLRLALGAYLIVMSLEYFVDPVGALKVWNTIYPFKVTGSWIPIIGVSSLLLSILFILGLFRPVTYALVILLQFTQVLSNWKIVWMINGGEWVDRITLLFQTAGFPILAAYFTLFLLRDADHWTFDGWFGRAKF